MNSSLNKIERYFKIRCMRYLERCFSKKTLQPNEIDYSSVKRLLVVRPHDQLGDFLLSTPVLKALRKLFPKTRIGILIRDYFEDAVRNNPYIDDILCFYKYRFIWTPGQIISLFRKLFRKWDMSIVLSSESHSFTSDLLAVLSGAKYILGSERLIFPGCTNNFFYNLIAPDSNQMKHQTERNLDIVKYIGAATYYLFEIVYVTKSEQVAIQKEFKDIYNNNVEFIIGIHIGANKAENRWPVERFSELAERLNNTLNIQIVIFWGPYEKELSRKFLESVKFKPKTVKPSSLRRQAVHFSLCDAVICNDTGIMHLCAAVGTPLVAIFGPTDPTYWKPIGDKFIAVRGRENKTENVSVEQVFKEVIKLIRI